MSSGKVMNKIERLILIEDDSFQLSWLHELCKPLANHIYPVRDGAAALASIDRYGMPDALICDLNMPGMDGIAFLRHLAVFDKPCPVLLMTAVSQEILHSVVEMAALHGLNIVEALQKPVSRQQISASLQQFSSARVDPAIRQKTEYRPQRDELLTALEHQQIRAYFQPQVCAVTGQLIGAEALARWEHPQRGILPPGVFIGPLCEHALYERFGAQILEQSIISCRQWLDLGIEMPVSVNIAPSELLDLGFTERTLALLDRHGLPGQLLCLEITETEGYDDLPSLLETTSRLRLHGIKLAMDDFGTGHASLLHLVQSPVTELKIDRVFVANMLDDNRYRSAVQASLSIARHLRLHTVAEGVENQNQARMLMEMGCDSLQGFYFAPAIAARELVNLWQQKSQMSSC